MTTKNQLIDFLLKTKIPDNLDAKEEYKINGQILKYCQEITPQNLYRYRACNENNFSTLEDNKFLLTKPTLFNDPYDSLLFIDRNKLINTLNKEIDYDVVKKLQTDREFRESQIELLGNDFVEKFSALKPFRNQMEKEVYNLISNKMYSKIMDGMIDESLKALKQGSLVSCLSEDYESIVMWSHYADNHKGFALNYDFRYINSADKPSEIDDKKLLPIKYSDERYDATYFVEFLFIKNYFKSLGLKLNQPFFDKLFFYKILLFKSIDWRYEKEWRIIKQTNIDYKDKKPDIDFITNIKPTEILLGSKIEEKNKIKLLEIANRQKVPVFQMKLEPFLKEHKLTKSDL